MMNPSGKAVRVGAGDDRFGTPLLYVAGELFHCKISGKDTGGGLCVYETFRTTKSGPPLHFHHEQDEWFFVRQGEFLFRIGDENFRLKAGDSVLAPRKVAHTFVNLGGEGVLIIAYQPAGTMEEFLVDASRLLAAKPVGEEWLALCRRHGVEIVGPQLKPD